MLSVIVPTYNEKDNIGELARRIFSSLKSSGIKGELIIVDDNSPDGTADAAGSLAGKYPIKVLKRAGKLGLASAVLEGICLSSFDILAVMDADLSHPPEALPHLFNAVRSGEADIAVGSRLVAGGGAENWPLHRKFISFVARILAKPLTEVRDLTSGYFAFKRSVIEGVILSPLGFKILLEILAKGKYDAVKEVPIKFSDRGRGRSKLKSKQVFEYLHQLRLLYRRRK